MNILFNFSVCKTVLNTKEHFYKRLPKQVLIKLWLNEANWFDLSSFFATPATTKGQTIEVNKQYSCLASFAFPPSSLSLVGKRTEVCFQKRWKNKHKGWYSQEKTGLILFPLFRVHGKLSGRRCSGPIPWNYISSHLCLKDLGRGGIGGYEMNQRGFIEALCDSALWVCTVNNGEVVWIPLTIISNGQTT